MMIFDYRRVAEILVLDSERGTWERGTGYLLCDGCLLTAFHVIQKQGHAGIKFRTLGQYEIDSSQWMETSNVPWKNKSFDLAIVQFETQSQNFSAIPWTRSVPVNHNISCQAQGFPRFRERKDENIKKIIFDPYLAKGTITWQVNPKKSGELLIDIQGANPNQIEHWKGLSGAALFSQDGYLLGTVIQGPEQLGGTQLEAIALETVVREDPRLNACLLEEFNQELFCFPAHNSDQEELYEDHMEMLRLRVKRSDLESEIVDLKHDYEGIRDRLPKTGENHGLSLKEQLYKLLDYIKRIKPEIIWNAWRANPTIKTIKRKLQDFEEVYSILNDSNQLSNFQRFLTQIYRDLQNPDNQLQECLMPFLDLTQAILHTELTQIEIDAPTPEIQHLSITSSGCWFIQIEEKSPVNDEEQIFEVTSWLISDRQTYQNSLDEKGKPTQKSLKYTKKIIDAVNFTVNAKDFEIFKRDVEANICELLNQLWEDPSLAIEERQPEVVFFIPKSLLSLDFESIELGLFNTLGLDLSVSISMLDRYKESQTLSKYRQYWTERWNVLKTYCDEPTRSHLEIYDHHCSDHTSSLDLSCPRKLRNWLRKQDLTRLDDRKVVGLGFLAPCSEFYEFLQNVIVNGLSIMILPQSALNEDDTKLLEQSLSSPPISIASAIKKYRICHSGDTGPIALWIDDPYLPPPDPDVYNG